MKQPMIIMITVIINMMMIGLVEIESRKLLIMSPTFSTAKM